MYMRGSDAAKNHPLSGVLGDWIAGVFTGLI